MRHLSEIVFPNLSMWQTSILLTVVTFFFLAEVTFFIWYHKMFPNISVFTGITFDVMLLVHSIINLLFSIFSIYNLLFLTISLKLCGFKLKNFRIRFSSYCIFYKRVYQPTKASNFFYEILRLFTSQNLRNTTTF